MHTYELKHNEDFDQGVMVALLPTTTFWSKIEMPHLTLVYVGETSGVPKGTANELAKEASALAAMNTRVSLPVMARDVFGEEKKVDVLTLRPTTALIAMRARLQRWNGSEYKNFRPHVTLGPVGSMYNDHPSNIDFDKIIVAWGNDHLVFSLN